MPFGEVECHMSTTGTTWRHKIFSEVKTGRVSFPAAQTKIRRRLRVRITKKEILNGDLLF